MTAMSVVNNIDLLHISRVILNMIDDRLTEHGTRVSYIVFKLLEAEGKRNRLDKAYICLIAFLHDVGAFKTDEIDDLINFDVTSSKQHSVYGSLFIKYFTPLSHLSDVILYHHTNYCELLKSFSDAKDLSSMLHLADRIDILTLAGKAVTREIFSEDVLNNKFSRKWYQLFETAESEHNILLELRLEKQTYLNELKDLFTVFDQEDIDVFPFLKMIIYSIDFRSPITAMHTFSTATVAVELAKKLNLSDACVQKIHYGAMLHDIGKVKTPLSILEKQGKLYGEEIDIMQDHVTTSREILDGFVPDDVLEIAVRHHEKLNGSGYPNGLVEKDLKISEKIVCVADIMSALLTKRSYKEAFDKDKIIDIITKLRDTNCIAKDVADVVIYSYDDIIAEVNIKFAEYIGLYEKIQEEYPLLINTLENL